MRGFSKAIITGNLTRDPETRNTTGGTPVCSFSVAVNRRYTTNGEQREEVSYFNCSAWGRTGETIQQYAHKGDAILVSGRLRQDRWEDKATGKTRSAVEIVVEDFNFMGSNDSNVSDGSTFTPSKKSVDKAEKNDKDTKDTKDVEDVPDDIPESDISLDEVPF